MKDRLILLFLPLVSAGYVLGALALGGGELWLAFTGERAPGRIAGVLKVRADSADYVGRLDHRIEFHFADGASATIEARDYQPVSLSIAGQAAPLSLLAGGDRDARLPADFPALAHEAIRADAAALRRLLQRQSRQTHPLRTVRLVKTETATVWRGLAPSAREFELQDARHAIPRGRPADAAVEVVTRAEFAEPADLRAARGDRMVAYARTIAGGAVEPHRQEFILFDEPYATAQIPVFIFTAGDAPLALLSDLGRHGPPTVAFPVFGDCTVAYDPAAPTQALLMPHLAPPDGTMPLLDWFSKFCESLFSRWGYVAILGFGATLAAAAALLACSLARAGDREDRTTQP